MGCFNFLGIALYFLDLVRFLFKILHIEDFVLLDFDSESRIKSILIIQGRLVLLLRLGLAVQDRRLRVPGLEIEIVEFIGQNVSRFVKELLSTSSMGFCDLQPSSFEEEEVRVVVFGLHWRHFLIIIMLSNNV